MKYTRWFLIFFIDYFFTPAAGVIFNDLTEFKVLAFCSQRQERRAIVKLYVFYVT